MNNIWKHPFVIYQEFNHNDESYTTKFQGLEINPDIGKTYNITAFLMKTFERVHGERYIFNDYEEAIKRLISSGAIVCEGNNRIHMQDKTDEINIDYLIQLIKQDNPTLNVHIHTENTPDIYDTESIPINSENVESLKDLTAGRKFKTS